MRAAEEPDAGIAAFDEPERDRELLASQEALGAVDRVETPEGVPTLGGRVEPSGVEELAEGGLGGRGRVAESGGVERLAGEPDQLLDHHAAARVERVGAFLANQ